MGRIEITFNCSINHITNLANGMICMSHRLNAGLKMDLQLSNHIGTPDAIKTFTKVLL